MLAHTLIIQPDQASYILNPASCFVLLYSSPSILQPSILRPPLIIRPLDLVPKDNFLC